MGNRRRAGPAARTGGHLRQGRLLHVRLRG